MITYWINYIKADIRAFFYRWFTQTFILWKMIRKTSYATDILSKWEISNSIVELIFKQFELFYKMNIASYYPIDKAIQNYKECVRSINEEFLKKMTSDYEKMYNTYIYITQIRKKNQTTYNELLDKELSLEAIIPQDDNSNDNKVKIYIMPMDEIFINILIKENGFIEIKELKERGQCPNGFISVSGLRKLIDDMDTQYCMNILKLRFDF